jgi:hypothetical protein
MTLPWRRHVRNTLANTACVSAPSSVLFLANRIETEPPGPSARPRPLPRLVPHDILGVIAQDHAVLGIDLILPRPQVVSNGSGKT